MTDKLHRAIDALLDEAEAAGWPLHPGTLTPTIFRDYAGLFGGDYGAVRDAVVQQINARAGVGGRTFKPTAAMTAEELRAEIEEAAMVAAEKRVW